MYRVKGEIVQARALDRYLAVVSYKHNQPTHHRGSIWSGSERVYSHESTVDDLLDLNLDQASDGKAPFSSKSFIDLSEADTPRVEVTVHTFYQLIEVIPENSFNCNSHAVCQCLNLSFLSGTTFPEKHDIVRLFTLDITGGFSFFEVCLNHVLAGRKACFFLIQTLHRGGYSGQMNRLVFTASSSIFFKIS